MKVRHTMGSLILFSIFLAACASGTATPAEAEQPSDMGWQEYYDLGVRYLSEGNYEEAIIAFTSAIEIDPMQASAYLGRGDAYVGLGDSPENLAAAQRDYEAALRLDETIREAYLRLAEVSAKLGDDEMAKQILMEGLENNGDPEFQRRIDELNRPKPKGGYPKMERFDDPSGSYSITEYDAYGHAINGKTFYADGSFNMGYTNEYDEFGNLVYSRSYSEAPPDAPNDFFYPHEVETYYDTSGRIIRRNYSQGQYRYNDDVSYEYTDGTQVFFSMHNRDDGVFFTHADFELSLVYEMESPNNTIRGGGVGFYGDATKMNTYIEEYNMEGNEIKETHYWEDGSIWEYTVYSLDDQGKWIGSVTYDEAGAIIRTWSHE